MAITFQRYNGLEWVTESEGGGGGISNHASLTNLAWLNSKHTGTANTVAGFDADGDAEFVDLAGEYVPYTGAVADVDLGSNSLTTDSVQFNTDYVNGSHSVGHMHWNADEDCVEVDMEGSSSSVTLQVGLETLLFARNNTGVDIPDGKLVYVSGSTGQWPTIALADNTDSDKLKVVGMTTELIAKNTEGYVCTSGLVRGLGNLGALGFNDGDRLYLNSAGGYTATHPTNPVHAVIVVGTVIKKATGTINIEPPLAFTIGNDFDGTMRQSVINQSDGTSAGSSFTAINDENYRVSLSIFGSNHSTLPNIAGIYNEGYGNTAYVTDGDKDHVFYTDPDDDHDFSALDHEVMRITADGDLLLRDSSSIGAGTATDLIELDGTAEEVTVNGGLIANAMFVNSTPTSDCVMCVEGGANQVFDIRAGDGDGLASSPPFAAIGNPGASGILFTGDGYSLSAVGKASTDGGDGGLLSIAIGNGGTASSLSGNNIGGDGGQQNFFGGSGGNADGVTSGNNVGGKGTTLNFSSGVGGNATNSTSSNIGGDGGDVSFNAGAAGTGGTSNGSSGNIYLGSSLGDVRIGSATAPAYPLDVTGDANATAYRVGGTAGASGSFTTADAKTVTVTNGIITGIV